MLSGCGSTTSVSTSNIESQAQQQKKSPTEVTSEQNTSSTPDKQSTSTLSPESLISASELDAGIKNKKNWTIIDVREPSEFATGHVPISTNIPLGKLEENLSEIPKDKDVILICLTGVRAHTAWQMLISKGYEPTKAKVLIGGMVQWKSLGNGEITDSIGGC
jgi:rhodanese-related sulfurtransferase